MRRVCPFLALSAITRALEIPIPIFSHDKNSDLADVQEKVHWLKGAPIWEDSNTVAEVGDIELDAVAIQDHDLALVMDTNSTDFPSPDLKKMRSVGYGLQWKKGLQNWVAFPLVGLLACKQYTTLGRMAVGKKHGSCQKGFKIWGKWRQLDGCNPATGMPKYLLDEEGNIIASCKAKRANIMCVKEGKIHIRGTCEDPPPEEDDGPVDEWDDGLDWLH